MTNRIQYSGGIWPLGEITVAASGTPVGLNTNVGAQSQTGMVRSTRFRQIVVNALPTNTRNLYLVFTGNGSLGASKATPNYIIDVIVPGASKAYPPVLIDRSGINIDYLSLDADVNGEGAAVYGVVA